MNDIEMKALNACFIAFEKNTKAVESLITSVDTLNRTLRTTNKHVKSSDDKISELERVMYKKFAALNK